MAHQDDFDPLKLSEFLRVYVSQIGKKSGDYYDVRNLNGQLTAGGTIDNHYTVTPHDIKGTITGHIKDLQVSGWFSIAQKLVKQQDKLDDYRNASVTVVLTQAGKPNEAAQVTRQMLSVGFVNARIVSGRSVQSGSYKTGDAFAEWILDRKPDYFVWQQTKRFQRLEKETTGSISLTALHPTEETQEPTHDPFAGYVLASHSFH